MELKLKKVFGKILNKVHFMKYPVYFFFIFNNSGKIIAGNVSSYCSKFFYFDEILKMKEVGPKIHAFFTGTLYKICM